MSKAWQYILLFSVSVFVFLCGYGCHGCTHECNVTDVVHTDTIHTIRVDTIRVERTFTDYIYDTIVVNDTVYIADIPRVYTDSTADYALNVRAVKMYDYRLDIFRVDTIIRYIQEKPTEPKKRGKMGQSVVIGLQVGYGLGVQPTTMQARFEPYIGIGITYGFGFTF